MVLSKVFAMRLTSSRSSPSPCMCIKEPGVPGGGFSFDEEMNGCSSIQGLLVQKWIIQAIELSLDVDSNVNYVVVSANCQQAGRV